MKNIQIILALSAVLFVAAQDCQNPLLTTFGIQGSQNPTRVQNLQYCTDLDDSLACCSADIVSGFNLKFQQTSSDMESQLRTTDQAYFDAINQDYRDFDKNWTKFNDYLDTIQDFNETLYNLTVTKYNYLFDTANNLSQAVDKLSGDFEDFQKDRTKCLETMLDLEASAHCLACNPNYRTFGVSTSGAVTMANSTCDRIKRDCFDYLQRSSQMSLLAAIKPVNEQIVEGVTTLEGLGIPGVGNQEINQTNSTSNETQVDTDSIVTKIEAIEPTTPSFSDTTINMTKLPTGCTSQDKCDWLCENGIKDGKVDIEALLLGGTKVNQWSNEQIANLSQIASGKRLLQQDGDDEDPNDEGIDVEGSGGQDDEGDDDNNNDDDDDDDDGNDGIFIPPLVDVEDTDAGEEGEEVILPGPTGEGEWEPARGESGIDISIDSNPADIDLEEEQNEIDGNDGSSIPRPPVVTMSGARLVASVVALIAGVLLF